MLLLKNILSTRYDIDKNEREEIKLKSYLVTGAAGFIGSAIAKKIIANGDSVVTIDNLSTGYESNIPEGCKFIQGNCYDSDVIKQLDKYRFDAIIHIAGQSSGEVSFENPVYDLQTNTQSTIMLLDYAKKTGCKKFVYASSMSTYGDHENPLVDEDTKAMPKSFYAVGKIASEHYMRIFSGYGICSTALRFFNVYGVGQNMSNLKQGMASIFMAMAIKDKHILVKGSKDRFRDFVYIDDVVDAVLKATERDGSVKPYEYYNVSTGIKQTVEQVINTICENLPFDVSVEYTSGTPGDQHGIFGDNSKIKNDLNWTPKIDFKTGISMMTKWALEEMK